MTGCTIVTVTTTRFAPRTPDWPMLVLEIRDRLRTQASTAENGGERSDWHDITILFYERRLVQWT